MAGQAQVEGVDVDAVTAWIGERVPALSPPLQFDLVAGGRSNLTFKVIDADGRAWVLRRPPLGHVLATAHDMGREHKIISALADTDVPVPGTVGLCEDDSVNGAPFYVMDFVEGTVVRSREEAEQLTEAARRHAGESLVDVLARIHAVDVDAVGLGELGRKEDYVARQLARWHRQWQQSTLADLTVIDDMHAKLAAAIPEQGPATIVHGDYRLDNCLIHADGEVAAVLDWEICTLGDPMADVGLLHVYWSEASDRWAPLLNAPTAIDGFLGRDELFNRYAERSGRDLSQLGFYVAFGYWKLACILAGVYTRWTGGAMGAAAEGNRDFEAFADQVRMLAEAASDAFEKMGQ